MNGQRSGAQVLGQLEDGVLRVQINRPEKLNAISAEMFYDMADMVQAAGSDHQVRAIMLTGAGRAFCSGADITGEESASTDTIEAGNHLVSVIRDVPRPVVAVVHGPAAGIGVALALSADLTVARTDAYFMLAFTKIGLMPDGGVSALVAASVGRAKAMRMALLGEKLPADEALKAGLISHAWDLADFDAELDALMSVLKSGPTAAFGATKHAINAVSLTQLPTAFDVEMAGQTELLESADFMEGVAAFGEKRPPKFSGK